MKKLMLLASVLCVSVLGFSQDYQDDCNDTLDIPSALTPNGDSMNDLFQIGFNCPPETFMMSIFNRWGSAVFSTEDYTQGWDGANSEGKPVPDGTFFWTIRYTFNGAAVKKTGNVTVLR